MFHIKMPKVSVIIPAYNAERFIGQTIESVFAQTFQDFEIIVIDDGSTDKTAEIVESFDVQCIRRTNGGVSNARNAGMEKAKGKYIAFLDADDLWEVTKLEKQVSVLDANEYIGLCYTAIERVDENGQSLYYNEVSDYPDDTEALLLYSCIIPNPSTAMMRRNLFEQFGGFDLNFTNYEDWEYWLRLSLQTRFAPVNEYLVKYRMVKGSASCNPQAVERDLKLILEKFFTTPGLKEKYRRLQGRSFSNNWMIVAGDYLHAGNKLSSIRCVWRALRFYPRNIARPLGLPLRWVKRWRDIGV